MAKTTAERQAAYRQRRDVCNDGEGDRRLNGWITSTADIALDRLAHRYGVTRRQMMERLIDEADSAILKNMNIDDPEWESYFNKGVTQ